MSYLAITSGVVGIQQFGALTKRSATDLVSCVVHDIEEAQTQKWSATFVTLDDQDLISQVFKIKFDKLLHDVKERNALGASIRSIYSIEYQKRGLPHSHLLSHLHPNDLPKTPKQIDEIVRAQILLDDPELASIVKSELTHGPCGPEFPNTPCMRDWKCSKGFPKRFCDETIAREGSYTEYARLDNGVRWGSERFMAYINVEIAGGVRAIKYLAKYIYKGSDRATLAVPGGYNEIEATLQGRYIGPSQAIWRLMGYATHEGKLADYFSHDEVRTEESTNQNDYTPEYLRQITGQGLATGILKLQVGMLVMLIRNYFSKLGFCNGSRLIVTHLLNRAIKGRIISQDPRFGGKEYIISRASITSGEDVPFTMVRKQLPLRPCFSMTINKSQGQTLKRVGVDLSIPTFTHGQLHVTLSRVTDVRNMIVLLPPEQRTTNNVPNSISSFTSYIREPSDAEEAAFAKELGQHHEAPIARSYIAGLRASRDAIRAYTQSKKALMRVYAPGDW
ncbi:hypothetical protein EPUL_005234, partial [Erysiphe pulchra]